MKPSVPSDDALWAAIADPSRRRLIDLLSAQGELSASKLATEVPFSRQAVAKHLAMLEKVGMVSQRKQGKEVLFAIRQGKLQEASLAMRHASVEWGRRLKNIKEAVERSEKST